MAIINQKSRIYWRLGFLALTIPSALIGFAGLRVTGYQLNDDRQLELSQQQQLQAIDSQADAELREAERASELGLKQATCGDTLSQFYFTPGMPVVDQLSLWGFDWSAARYNTDRWYPLFDSNGLLFAAIKQGGAIVQADTTPLDQASICNLNKLMP